MTLISSSSMRDAFLLPSAPARKRGDALASLAVVSSVATALGLFTISWERLGNLGVGPYNVKLSSVLFSVAAVTALPVLRDRLRLLRSRRTGRIASWVVVAITALLLLATALSHHPLAGVAQIVAVLTGAVLPALAICAAIADLRSLRWALSWYVAGAVVASVFGLYQLVAFYLGWPQLLGGTDAGVDGVTGRIQGFDYEPAYFAVFIVFALAASATRALLERRVLSWWAAVWFSGVLVLANVRALMFLLPVVAVLLALRWRTSWRILLRLAIAGALVIGVDVAVTAVVTANGSSSTAPLSADRTVAPQVSSSAAAPSVAASAAPSAAPPEAKTKPARRENPPESTLDPNEQSSNAPRLGLYRAVLDVDAGHPLLGVGPGNLGAALQSEGYAASNQGGSVVANNIWLQAVADGGIGLLVAELALVLTAVALLFQKRVAVLQPLIAAWVAVLVVDGLLTSYFFDAKVWVVLAIILMGGAVLTRESDFSAGTRTRAARRGPARG